MKNYFAKQVFNSLFYPLIFVALIWLVFLLQNTIQFNFSKLGVFPRKTEGLVGVITSVFIHHDLKHIFSNTIPLLVLGMMLFYFYKKIAKPVFFWLWIISGLWLWIGGRNSEAFPSYHIGASTLVYALASFLFFSGVFRRHARLMAISLLVVFIYGGIVWGVLPIKPDVSWEGHLFGSIAGILVAFNYRKEGPQRRVHVWPEEKEEESDEIPYWQQVEEIEVLKEKDPEQPIQITYIYKEKNTPNDK